MMVSEPPYHNQPPWDVDGRSELDAEINRLRAENAALRAALEYVLANVNTRYYDPSIAASALTEKKFQEPSVCKNPDEIYR